MSRKLWHARSPDSQRGFTLVELVFVVGSLALLACVCSPALARTRPSSHALRCQNNLRQLGVLCRQWTDDNSDYLLTCTDGLPYPRTNWFSGLQDFNGANPANLDPNQTPLWPYLGGAAGLFRCPADRSVVYVNGVYRPRVRSYSMSQVFSRGEWLDGTYNPGSYSWRTYAKQGEIVFPARTYLLIDEHPSSINDAAFANVCTGAQPNDPPGNTRIIDFPAAQHNGAANLSFADGHAETHHWTGSYIRNAPLTGELIFNIAAGTSAPDIRWLAANTTVRK